MMDDIVEDFLKHHGVLGMHWGVRKSESREKVARKPKKLSRRQQVKLAKAKMISGHFVDPTSAKTVKLGHAASSAFLAGTGALGVGLLSRNAKVRTGAYAVSILLNATSLGLAAGSHRSSDSDVLRVYGKK